MIRILKSNDISGLNRLPPQEWHFDYEDFLYDFINEDFFHAFVMIQGNEIVGTGNALLKNNMAWLANILVDEKFRGQGFGSQMTQFLVDFLASKGATTQLLIATELGEPIYRKIGFQKVTTYHCFDTMEAYEYQFPKAIRPITAADYSNIIELDRHINGESRAHLLRKFMRGGWGYYQSENQIIGCYLPHFGRGLVIATDKKAGLELLALKHAQKGQRTLLPIENQAGIDFLTAKGFTTGYHCSRMVLGEKPTWQPTHIYSYGSGYCG